MEKLAIFNLWVDKNNHTNIYTTEGEYHRLLEITLKVFRSGNAFPTAPAKNEDLKKVAYRS